MEARYMTDLEWRICHAVNIYVFKNGMDGETPVLVHIAPAKKKNMKTVMNAIQERVKFPVGYAAYLYKMDGKRVRHPCELEMYNNYVVASNYDKHFKCAQYGRKRSPLLVLNRDSKHIRVLRQHNENYHEWMLKKKAVGEERPQFIFPTFYTNENARAQDLPIGQMGNFMPPGTMCATCPTSAKGKGYTVNTATVENDPTAQEAVRALQEKLQGEMSLAEAKYSNKKINHASHPKSFHSSDILNANVESTRLSSRGSDVKFSDGDASETGMETDTMGSKFKLELQEFKKAVKKRAAKELEAKSSESSIDLAPQKGRRKQGNETLPTGVPLVPLPPERFRDGKTEFTLETLHEKTSSHSQQSDSSRATYSIGPDPATKQIPGTFATTQPHTQFPTLTPRQLPQNNGGVLYHPFMQFSPAVYPLIPHPHQVQNRNPQEHMKHLLMQPQPPNAYSDSVMFQTPSSFTQSNASSENNICSSLDPSLNALNNNYLNQNGAYGHMQQPFVYAMIPNPGMHMQNYCTLPYLGAQPPNDKSNQSREENPGDKSEAEVDIPFTPFVGCAKEPKKRYKNLRSLKVDIAPAKSRNVAIQMGFPTPSREERDRYRDRDRNATPQHHQHAPRSMIPVKISFDTPNGEKYLDQGFILAPKDKNQKSHQQGHGPHHLPRLENQAPISRVYRQTSNASTQVNGPSHNQNIRRAGNSINIFSMEKYLEGIERENTKQFSEVNELSEIPPPSAFQESFRHIQRRHPNASRRREFYPSKDQYY